MVSKKTGVPKNVVEMFQKEYFDTFPEIQKWWSVIAVKVSTTGVIDSIFGRRKKIFQRPDDKHTLNTAISFDPQNTVASLCIQSGYKLQAWNLKNKAGIQCLNQAHDGNLYQVPKESLKDLLPIIRRFHEVELSASHEGETRSIKFPVDLLVGDTWFKDDAEKA